MVQDLDLELVDDNLSSILVELRLPKRHKQKYNQSLKVVVVVGVEVHLQLVVVVQNHLQLVEEEVGDNLPCMRLKQHLLSQHSQQHR